MASRSAGCRCLSDPSTVGQASKVRLNPRPSRFLSRNHRTEDRCGNSDETRVCKQATSSQSPAVASDDSECTPAHAGSVGVVFYSYLVLLIMNTHHRVRNFSPENPRHKPLPHTTVSAIPRSLFTHVSSFVASVFRVTHHRVRNFNYGSARRKPRALARG